VSSLHSSFGRRLPFDPLGPALRKFSRADAMDILGKLDEFFLKMPHFVVMGNMFFVHGGVPVFVKNGQGERKLIEKAKEGGSIIPLDKLTLENLFAPMKTEGDFFSDIYIKDGNLLILWNDVVDDRHQEWENAYGRGQFFGEKAVGNNIVLCAHERPAGKYANGKVIRVFTTGKESSQTGYKNVEGKIAIVDYGRVRKNGAEEGIDLIPVFEKKMPSDKKNNGRSADVSNKRKPNENYKKMDNPENQDKIAEEMKETFNTWKKAAAFIYMLKRKMMGRLR
jgi:hypothetical protein